MSGPSPKLLITQRQTTALLEKIQGLRTLIETERNSFRIEKEDLIVKCDRISASKTAVEKGLSSQLAVTLASYQKLLSEFNDIESVSKCDQAQIKCLNDTKRADLGIMEQLRSDLNKATTELAVTRNGSIAEKDSLIASHKLEISRLSDALSIERDKSKSQADRFDVALRSTCESTDAHEMQWKINEKQLIEEINNLQENIRLKDCEIVKMRLNCDAQLETLREENMTAKEENSKLIAKLAESQNQVLLVTQQVTDLTEIVSQNELVMTQLNVSHEEKATLLKKDILDLKMTQTNESKKFQRELKESQNQLESLELNSRELVASHKSEIDSLRENLKTQETIIQSEKDKQAEIENRLLLQINAIDENRMSVVDENHQLLERLNAADKEKLAQRKGYELKIQSLNKDLEVINLNFEKTAAVKDSEINNFMELCKSNGEEILRLQVEQKSKDIEFEKSIKEKEKGFDKLLNSIVHLERSIDLEKQKTQREKEKVAATEKDAQKKERVAENRLAGLHEIIEQLNQQREISYMNNSEMQAQVILTVNSSRSQFYVERDSLLSDLERVRSERLQLKEDLSNAQTEICIQSESNKRISDDFDRFKEKAEIEAERLRKTIEGLNNEKLYGEENALNEQAGVINENRKLNEDIRKVQFELEQTKLKLAAQDELEYVITKLEGKVEEVTSQFESAKKTIRQKDLQISDIKKETADMIYTKEFSYKKLLTTVSDMQKETDKVNAMNESHQRHFEQTLNEKEIEIKSLKAQLYAMNREEASRIEKATESIRKDFEGFELRSIESIKQLEATNDSLKAQMAKDGQFLDGLKNANLHLHDEKNSLANNLHAKILQFDDIKIKCSKSEEIVKKLNARIENFEKEKMAVYEDFLKEIERVKNTAQDTPIGKQLLAEISCLRTELEQKSDLIDNLQIEFNSAREEVRALISEKIKIISDAKERVEKEQLRMKQVIFDNNEMKAVLISELQKVQNTCKALEKQLKELPLAFETEKMNHQTQATFLNQQIIKITSDNSDLLVSLNNLRAKNDSLEHQFEEQLCLAAKVFDELETTENNLKGSHDTK